MGTSLTNEQVNIIKKLRAKVILMFDNDNAGEIATFTNGNILTSSGITPEVVRLSGEKDPDEYIIKNGVSAILNNIAKPIGFLDFKLQYLRKDKDLNKTEDLVNYIKEVVSSIKDIEDDLTKEVIIKKISDNYNVPLDLIKRELKKVSNTPKEKKEVVIRKETLTKYDILSENILYYMMNDGIYINIFKKDLGYFNIKKYRSIANEIIYYYESNKNIDLASFITFVSNKDYIYNDVMNIIKDLILIN